MSRLHRRSSCRRLLHSSCFPCSGFGVILRRFVFSWIGRCCWIMILVKMSSRGAGGSSRTGGFRRCCSFCVYAFPSSPPRQSAFGVVAPDRRNSQLFLLARDDYFSLSTRKKWRGQTRTTSSSSRSRQDDNPLLGSSPDRIARATGRERRNHSSSSLAAAASTPSRQEDEDLLQFASTQADTTTMDDATTASDASSSPILQDLNPSQIQAVTQPVNAIARVVAGPGSGKTRVLTSRIAWLLQQTEKTCSAENNSSDPRILAVTFTRKAAGEMQQRLHKLLAAQQEYNSINNINNNLDDDESMLAVVEGGDHGTTTTPAGLDRVTLGTFHSVCAKILRWNGDLLASLPSVMDDMSSSHSPTVLSGTFNIADQSEQLRLLNEILKEYKLDVTMKQYNIRATQVLNKISWCKSQLAHGEKPFPSEREKERKWKKAIDIAAQVYYPYREKLLSSNCIDFDDLILMTRELLLCNEEIRDRLQRRWKHVLIDEFQDTSRSQLDLVKLLTSDSLFVVGDADQSIYSWRGAHAGSLSEFAKEFHMYSSSSSSSDDDGDGVSTVYLMENYRSTSNIVKAAQKIISSSGKSSSGADKLRQDMIPKRSSGKPPRIIACSDAQEEAEFVVRSVKEMVDAGEYGPDHSTAFIYRTNAQSRALEEACVRFNLPYVVFGTATSFYKRQEVKDCLCFLRWLYNGRDRISMVRALTTPKRGIGDKAIAEFEEYCSLVGELWEELSPGIPKATPLEILFYLSGDESWVAWKGAEFPPPSLTLSTRTLKLLTEFSKQMVAIRDRAKIVSVEETLSFIVNELELVPHWDKISKTKDEFEERQANVQELRQASRRYSNDGACLQVPASSTDEDDAADFVQSPLGNFLDDVALVTEMADSAERSAEDRHVANMMTIHASKGMEFDSVFLVGLEEGTLPTSQALEKDKTAMEEEKRLCYVAMTRAKSELLMTWRKEVPIFTANGLKYVPKNRSRFLDVLVSKTSKKGKRAPPNDGAAVGGTQRKKAGTNPGPASRQYRAATRAVPMSSHSRSASPMPQKKRKVNGTAGVYSRKTSSPFDRAGDVTRTMPPLQKPSVQPRSQSPGRRKSEHSSPRPESRLARNGSGTRKKATDTTQSTGIDSTWFFPVGSKVKHRQLGEGVVLPPKAKVDGEQDVVVRFSSGEQKSFPLHGSDLSPVLL